MFNPAPPPPPPASDDKSTEFPPEILNAFVPSLKDSVCSEPVLSVVEKPKSVICCELLIVPAGVEPPLPNPAAAALAEVK